MMQYASGITYDGKWAQDKWDGQGTLIGNDSTYKGAFVNGKKEGNGHVE
jgi:hypothetical protein